MLTSRGWKVSNSILKRSANKSHCIQSDLIAVSKEQAITAAKAEEIEEAVRCELQAA